MKNQETAVVTTESSLDGPHTEAATRRPYTTPRLSTFGAVSALTGSGSGMNPENMTQMGTDRARP